MKIFITITPEKLRKVIMIWKILQVRIKCQVVFFKFLNVLEVLLYPKIIYVTLLGISWQVRKFIVNQCSVTYAKNCRISSVRKWYSSQNWKTWFCKTLNVTSSWKNSHKTFSCMLTITLNLFYHTPLKLRSVSGQARLLFSDFLTLFELFLLILSPRS